MNPLDLNEAQGLTADLVRKDLLWLGYRFSACKKYPICQSLERHTHQGADSDTQDFIIPDRWENQWQIRIAVTTIEYAAAVQGLSLQQWLRQVNPRMRCGWPSDAALDAHRGIWLVGVPDAEAIIAWPPETIRERRSRAPNANVKCWPCDAAGNKVRWPTNDKGGML